MTVFSAVLIFILGLWLSAFFNAITYFIMLLALFFYRWRLPVTRSNIYILFELIN